MAATNFTPIQLYFSTTASAVPTAANLAQGELAININDGKLYYEDSTGVVQVIATKGAGTIGGSTTQIQYNNAGALAGNAAMVFNSGTSTTTLTTLNLTNALGAIYGGTAQSTYTQGDVLYSSAANTLAKLSIGAVNYILASTGSVPQWVAPSSISVLTATNLAGGLAGSVPYQSALDTTTFLAIGAANRVMTSTGTAPQWVTSLTGLTGVSSTSLTASTTLGVTGVSTLTAGAIVQGLTVGLGAGAVSTNTAVGVSALSSNSTGAQNTAVGYQAGLSISTGDKNTAFGASIMDQSAGVTGQENAAFGRVNMRFLTSGSYNTALGNESLLKVTSGSNNTAVGFDALLNNLSASNNTAVGYQAGYTNVTGASNVYVGTLAGKDATSNSNVFVGKDAGLTVSSGGGNTYIGFGSGPNVSAGTGTTNAMVGYLSGNKLTTGSNNTSLGSEALFSNTTASNNTAVGYQAGYTNTTGSEVTAVGYQAGYRSTAGYSTFVGHLAGVNQSTGDANTYIGRGITGLTTAGASTGSNNTAMGNYALSYLTSGSNNVAIGPNALNSNTTASYNTAVGYQAGNTNSTGAKNTYLGAFAGYTSNSAGDAFNVFVGYTAGYYTTGVNNTFVGQGSGQDITTGAKNTIIGRYTGNQDSLDISTASNYVVLSDGDGNRQITMKEGQTLALDSAVPNTGTGITFPADATTNPSANANTLDDYEEGTWTVQLQDSSNNNATMEAGFTTATYVKIGRQVTVCGVIYTSSVAALSGSIFVSGLPFTVGNSNRFRSAGSTSAEQLLNISSGQKLSVAINQSNATKFEIWISNSGTGGSNMTAAEWSNDGFCHFNLTYFTD